MIRGSHLASCLPEPFVGRHESLEHRRDKLGGIGRRLVALTADRLGICDEIAMNGGRQLDGELDGLVVWDGDQAAGRRASAEATWRNAASAMSVSTLAMAENGGFISTTLGMTVGSR